MSDMTFFHWVGLVLFVGVVAFTPAGQAIGNVLINAAKLIIGATSAAVLVGTNASLTLGALVATPLYALGWMLKWALPLLILSIVMLPFWTASHLIWPRVPMGERPAFVQVAVQGSPRFSHRNTNSSWYETTIRAEVHLSARPGAPRQHAEIDGLICDVAARATRDGSTLTGPVYAEILEGPTSDFRRASTWVGRGPAQTYTIKIDAEDKVESAVIHSCRAYGNLREIGLDARPVEVRPPPYNSKLREHNGTRFDHNF